MQQAPPNSIIIFELLQQKIIFNCQRKILRKFLADLHAKVDVVEEAARAHESFE